MIKLIECPRDAMQGIKHFIPTEKKIEYINSLLEVGFDTIDVGSFVSPKAIPQMADTALVLSKLNWSPEKSKLLAIIANTRGAKEAAMFDQISFLGFPFSVSETFQQRNTNSSIEESLKRVEEIQNLFVKYNKQLVIYISMGFGNPYGDLWSPEIVMQWTEKMIAMGIKIISLADTIGVADPKIISMLFKDLIPQFPNVEFGAHLHTTPETWREKIEAAYENGCRRFDGAIKGYGGCPMAKDELTGNMPTENLISFFEEKGIELQLNKPAFLNSMKIADDLFLR
ncbi:MAG TPA: hydroxymethylglutaryl-CoA lyase [Chitinophagales bacterium]|nr:hydroxymethylglutaryl-CoA lyase [Chitinophagales bacterium]